jgi:hypothetical protein
LWQLTKGGHLAEARVRATPAGPELRLLIDDELWWSQVVRPATEDALTAAADLKREAFKAKGWAPAGRLDRPGRT